MLTQFPFTCPCWRNLWDAISATFRTQPLDTHTHTHTRAQFTIHVAEGSQPHRIRIKLYYGICIVVLRYAIGSENQQSKQTVELDGNAPWPNNVLRISCGPSICRTISAKCQTPNEKTSPNNSKPQTNDARAVIMVFRNVETHVRIEFRRITSTTTDDTKTTQSEPLPSIFPGAKKIWTQQQPQLRQQ